MERWVGMEFIELFQLVRLFVFGFKYKYQGDKTQGKE
jgi:hypothetical protein